MSPSVMRSRLLPDGVGRLEQVCFSGRRRHTRWPRDWSSDVCSSDLWLYFTREVFDLFYPSYGDTWPTFNGAEIGRASCRERVRIWLVPAAVRRTQHGRQRGLRQTAAEQAARVTRARSGRPRAPCTGE